MSIARPTFLLLLVVAVGLALGVWTAQAEPERTVDERLSAMEARLEKVERQLADLVEQQEAGAARIADARRLTNDVVALATLRNVISAQAQLQQSAKIDMDNDGVGEYGGFLELSGATAGRMMAPLRPAVLSEKFRVLSAEGAVHRNGYFFRIALPGADEACANEPQKGYAPSTRLAVQEAEAVFVCYAWPEDHGVSGNRTCAVSQRGDIHACDAAAYSGVSGGPAPHAALAEGKLCTGVLADGVKGRDGHVWRVLSN